MARRKRMRRLARVMRAHPWILGAFCAVLAGLVLLTGRLVTDTREFHAAPANLLPQPWMTVGLIARSWDLERDEVAALIDLAPGEAKGVPLARIAAGRGLPRDALAAELRRELPVLISTR